MRLEDIKIFNNKTLLCLKFCIYLFYWIYSPSLTRFSIFQRYIYHYTTVYWYYVGKLTKSNTNHVACIVYLKAIYNIVYLFSSVIITPFNYQFLNQDSKVSHIILFCYNDLFLGDCGLMVWFYAELNKLLTTRIFTIELVVYNNDNFQLFYFPNLNTILRTLANWNFSFLKSSLLHNISFITLSSLMCSLIILLFAAFYIYKIYSNLKVFH